MNRRRPDDDEQKTQVRPEPNVSAGKPTPRQSDLDFQHFYARELQGIYRGLALAFGDAELAGEATHEGMVRAYQKWRRISRYDNPAGWVYRVGLNWGRSRMRRVQREVLTDLVGDESRLAGRESPSWRLDGDSAVAAAMAQLSVEARAVVVLRYVLDWSTADVASALGVAPGTVKSRLARALDKLQLLLEDER